MKQKNAFAPNFIHSLDSSHMMLTSLYCEQAGITFMSVHDCFWTHPCTVDVMNRVRITKTYNNTFRQSHITTLSDKAIMRNVLFFRFAGNNSSRFTASPFSRICPNSFVRNMKRTLRAISGEFVAIS